MFIAQYRISRPPRKHCESGGLGRTVLQFAARFGDQGPRNLRTRGRGFPRTSAGHGHGHREDVQSGGRMGRERGRTERERGRKGRERGRKGREWAAEGKGVKGREGRAGWGDRTEEGRSGTGLEARSPLYGPNTKHTWSSGRQWTRALFVSPFFQL